MGIRERARSDYEATLVLVAGFTHLGVNSAAEVEFTGGANSAGSRFYPSSPNISAEVQRSRAGSVRPHLQQSDAFEIARVFRWATT